MRYFDEVLRSRDYVAGDAFSMADITVFAGLAFADAAGIPIDASLTSLLGWRSRVADRESVRNRSGQAFVPEDLRRLGF